MSGFYGNFKPGQTVRCRFNTVNSSGVPTTLTAGAVAVSKDGADVTPSGGVTLTADAGGVTGRHHVVIDMSVDPAAFTTGSDYAVRLSGSSAVGGTSVAGAVVGEWSVANRASVPQTGDAFARVGAAGAGLTALGDARLANLDAAVSSRSTFAGLGATAPAGWVNAAAVGAAALNGKGDWLTTLGARAPAGWLNTAAYDPLGVTLPDARLAHLDADVSGRQPAGPVALTPAYDAAKTAASQASVGAIPTNPLTTLGATAPAGWVNAAAVAALALNGKGDWLTAAGYAAPDNTTVAATNALLTGLVVAGDHTQFSAHALSLAPATGGGGSVTVAGYAAGQDPAALLAAAGYTAGRAARLDNLDAAVSTRSTFAGGDTPGTTTLLGRLTAQRGANLDNLDAAVSTRSTYAGGAVAAVTAPVNVNLSQTGLAPRDLAGVADAALTLGDALACAVVAAAGPEAVAGTAYTRRTPAGTVVRAFTLDSPTAPTARN